MEQLATGNNMTTASVPSIPALINGSTGNGSETRLALIAQNDTAADSGGIVVSGGIYIYFYISSL